MRSEGVGGGNGGGAGGSVGWAWRDADDGVCTTSVVVVGVTDRHHHQVARSFWVWHDVVRRVTFE